MMTATVTVVKLAVIIGVMAVQTVFNTYRQHFFLSVYFLSFFKS